MLPYIGGKSYLASWIISKFPENYRKLSYCEVFGGGGWVLFKKDLSNIETYNDLNKNLVNLFRVIRDNYKEFEHRAQWSLHSREMYDEARKRLADDKFLSDLEKAMHYALIKCQTFSAQNSPSWGYGVISPKLYSGKWLPFLKRLSLINARLKRVQIECLDFERLIAKYDRPDTLFYLDPPYVDVEYYYNVAGVDFQRKDHERLAAILKQIKGKFVLSYYKHPLVKQLYGGHNIAVKITSKHSAGITINSKTKIKPKATEWLITNY